MIVKWPIDMRLMQLKRALIWSEYNEIKKSPVSHRALIFMWYMV